MTGAAARGGWPTLGAIARAAVETLDEAERDFILGGAETETTLKRNRRAFDRLALVPRILRPADGDPCRTRLFGIELPAPILPAPMGTGRHFGPQATAPLVEGAHRFGGIACVSTVAQPTPDRLRRDHDGPIFLQAYLLDGAAADPAAALAAQGASRFDGLIVTLDSPVYGRRDRDAERGVSPAPGVVAPGRALQPDLDWTALARLRDAWPGPLVAKGVAQAEDAARLLALGVDAIWVSNHGGRQLDHGEAALDSLRRVGPAVSGRAPVIVDGGVCRGTDVAKALALGADAVAVGKALALAASVDAVHAMLGLLRDELATTLALLGCGAVGELGPGHLADAEPVGAPCVLEALGATGRGRADRAREPDA